MINNEVKVTLVVPDMHLQAPIKQLNRFVRPAYCHDPNAISLVLQVMNDLKPDEVIQLGDICEMNVLSHWNKTIGRGGMVKGEDGKWYCDSWANTMKMVDAFWLYIRKKLPRAELHQIEGNHDYWSKLVFEDQTLAPFAEELAFRNRKLWAGCNIDYREYDGNPNTELPWVDVGRLRVLHGYKTSSPRRMRQEHDNVMYGHQHKIFYDPWDASSREMRRAYCIGCLTKLHPDYNSMGGAQNGWAQAFAVIYTMPDTKFSVQVVEILDGIIPCFNGKTYYAKPNREIHESLSVLDL